MDQLLEFFRANATAIYWIVGVVAVSALLFYLINRGGNYLIRKGQERGLEDLSSLVGTVQKILRTFLFLFLILFATYFLVDKKEYAAVTDNIKLISYLTVVATLTFVLDSVLRAVLNRVIRRKNRAGENPTTYKFLKYVGTFIIYLLGIVLAALAFPSLTGVAQTALGGAGILAVVIGIASQEALANLVGGFFIIIFKPFQVRDIIKISDDMVGTVTDITLRHTLIRDYQNKMIVIPNSIINKEKVTNFNLGELRCCEWIEVGISYDSDIDLAKAIMREECMAHPNLVDNRNAHQKANGDEQVLVRVISPDESSITLRAWAWAQDFPSAFVMKCDLLESIKKRFDAEGVEIPFPYRTLVFKNEGKESESVV